MHALCWLHGWPKPTSYSTVTAVSTLSLATAAIAVASSTVFAPSVLHGRSRS